MQRVCTNTFSHYQDILRFGLEQGYRFITCQQYINAKLPVLTCVLRHDVDLSPERSINLAELEHSLKIKATYFFRVHANEYNLLGYETISIIKDLDQMGHEIGLHAEPIDINKATNFDSGASLELGKRIIEKILEHPILGVASHNDPTPNNNLDYFKANSYQQYGFNYEVYDENLGIFKNACYVTDSHPWHWRTFRNGQLTDEQNCLCHYFNRREPYICCLIHPHMWYKLHFHRVHY